MKTRTKLLAVSAVLALGVAGYAFTAASEEASPGFGPMHGGMSRMMGSRMGPAMMGMRARFRNDEANRRHPRTDRQPRSSSAGCDEFTPDGIRTETTSDDPKVAEWIKTHVSEMGARVEAGDDPGLPIESEALHAIFAHRMQLARAWSRPRMALSLCRPPQTPQQLPRSNSTPLKSLSS